MIVLVPKQFVYCGDVEKKLTALRDKTDLAPILLRLMEGETLEFPMSRSLPSVGHRCHELRLTINKVEWRLIYRTDNDAIIFATVFKKKQNKIPKRFIELSKKRLREYDRLIS